MMNTEVSLSEVQIKKMDRRISVINGLMLIAGLLMILAIKTGFGSYIENSFALIGFCVLVLVGMAFQLSSYVKRRRMVSELSRIQLIERLEIPQTEITL